MASAALTMQLQAAKARARLAEGNCPHWDYDSPSGDDHPCCQELRAADNAVRTLRRRIQMPKTPRRSR